jgi:hypothetical protein
MCIVSFVQCADKAILSFNRDEDPARPFIAPELDLRTGIFEPKDSVSGGTWIGLKGSKIYCLQNGAEAKHERQPPYALSRGNVLHKLIESDGKLDIDSMLDSLHVEPFTISVFDLGNETIELLIYNGREVIKKNPAYNLDFIQCSSTLYNVEAKQLIQENFTKMLSSTCEADSILDFHQAYKIGGIKNNFVPKPATSSIIQFVIDEKSIKCLFIDLIQTKNYSYQFEK